MYLEAAALVVEWQCNSLQESSGETPSRNREPGRGGGNEGRETKSGYHS